SYSLILLYCNTTLYIVIYNLSLHDALPISDLVAISGRNKGKPILNFAYIGQFDRLINLVHLNDGGKVVIDASDLNFDMGYMPLEDRKSTRLNSSHVKISYAVFCLKKKKKNK